MNPLVSIIVPLFNAEKYLLTSVSQILRQTYDNFELLLIDDGSEDGSLNLCQKIASKDSRTRVLHQENSGVSAARNIGLENASGEYIAFVDSDDLIAPYYLEYLVEGIQKSDSILSMCSHARIYGYDYEFTKTQEQFEIIPAQKCAQRLLCGYFPVSVWGCLIKTSLIGNIRFPAGIRNNEDKLFLYEYLLKNENGTVAFSNEKLYGYMVREGSATRRAWNGSLDVVTIADQIREDTIVHHPEWGEIARNACLSARLDVMKSIVRSERSDHGDERYERLRTQVLAYGWPKTGDRRLKVEFIAARLGRPAYRALVQTYYKLNNDEKRFKLNEKRTRQ